MSRPGSPSGFSGYAAAASELSSSTWEVLSQVGRAIRASIPSDLEGMDDPANPDPAPAAAAFATMRPSPALDAAFARLRGHAGSRERARGNLGTTGAAPPGVPDVQLPEADRPEESTSYHQGQLEARDAITSYQNAGEQWSSLNWVPPDAPGPLDATQALALQHHCMRLQERCKRLEEELRRKEREIDRLTKPPEPGRTYVNSA